MEQNNNLPGRKAFKKSDGIIIVVVLALCLGALGFFAWQKNRRPAPTGANYAVLTLNGEFLEAFDLGLYQEHTVMDLKEKYGVPGQLEFDQGAVRFIQMDCPDKICEMAGYVKEELDAAICLPNRVALMVYTPEDYEGLLKQLGLSR